MGSGNGKTAGPRPRGRQVAFRLVTQDLGWEGGQMPLYRRVPKRGFNNKIFKKVYTTINVEDLAHFEDGSIGSTWQTVLAAGLVSKAKHSNLFKILGNGTLIQEADGSGRWTHWVRPGEDRSRWWNRGDDSAAARIVRSSSSKGDTEPTPKRKKRTASNLSRHQTRTSPTMASTGDPTQGGNEQQ